MDWSLFISALISSTLLPGGSEVLLLYKLHQGLDAQMLIMVATAGNVLGSLITYAMGCLGYHYTHARWSPHSRSRIDQAQRWFTRYGQFSLLFAWLPFIGDPLCLVAGLLRSSLPVFIVFVTVGKSIRYALLTLLPV